MIRFSKLITPCCLLVIFQYSCLNKKNRSEGLFTDTTSFQDSAISNKPETTAKPDMDGRKNNKLDTTSEYGPGYTEDNEVELLDKKIIFNSDFQPFLETKVKNNMKISLVALEINLKPHRDNQNCDTTIITIRKKINIKPNKVGVIRQRIPNNSQNSCKVDNYSIYLGDCIFANGEKISMDDVYRNLIKDIKVNPY